MKKKSILSVLSALLFLAFLSCGGASGDSDLDDGSLRVSLNFVSRNFCSLSASKSAEDAISRQNFDRISSIVITGVAGSETVEETIQVAELPVAHRIFFPLGQVFITVQGFDANGGVVCRGGVSIIVNPGENNDVVIQCVLAEPPNEIEQICNDGLDNDSDGDADCEDGDCNGGECALDGIAGVCVNRVCDIESAPTPTPTPISTPIPTDTPTTPTPLPAENCSNGLDDDGDGAVDCQDSNCFNNPVCTETAAECSDSEDNDGDNLVDCADSSCAGQMGPQEQLCEMPESATCADGADNDGDNFIDCADSSCAGQTGPCGEICETPEATCSDSFDNDGDGQADCSDSDCDGTSACTETGSECGDSQDNDGDDSTDCADSDCEGQTCMVHGIQGTCSMGQCLIPTPTPTPTITPTPTPTMTPTPTPMTEIPGCGDGIDNDGDGLTDCADTDCASSAGCEFPESTCFDNFDNDGDSDVDCQDTDCDGNLCLLGGTSGVCIDSVCQFPR